MKTGFLTAGVLACYCSASFPARAQQPPAVAVPPVVRSANGGGHGIEFMPKNVKPPVGKAMTDDELKRRRASEKFNGFVTEEERPKGWDLMEYSEFIGMDGFVTLVPKGAIIHVPERFKANVLPKAVGRFLSWPEFSARYRGLVVTREVTIEEASGAKAIEVKAMDAVRKGDLITVAILGGNPISVAKSSIPPENKPGRQP